jgi:hypothetical protein
MERKMLKITFVASAILIAAGASGFAANLENPLYRQANVAAPWGSLMTADQREVIAPPGGVDPDMAIPPPETGARMPILRPGMPDGKSGFGR